MNPITLGQYSRILHYLMMYDTDKIDFEKLQEHLNVREASEMIKQLYRHCGCTKEDYDGKTIVYNQLVHLSK